MIDTLRADAILDPDGRYDTPNLDGLGREGILFPRAFAAAPMTLPSHMSLFSSRLPSETGVLNNGQNVPLDLPLLAEWLASHGYDTRAVISLGTLTAPDLRLSPGRGFRSYAHDDWYMAPAARTNELLLESLRARKADEPLFLFAHFADPHEPYDAHGTVDNRVQFSVNDEPFLELVSSEARPWSGELTLPAGRTRFRFTTSHPGQTDFMVRTFSCLENWVPLELQWEHGSCMEHLDTAVVAVDRGARPSAKCQLKVWVNDAPGSPELLRERYALEVAYVDRHVGALLDELERLGLYEDSLILFTSDHGEALGEHHHFGHVELLTDEMIHVPLILRLPASDPRRAQLSQAAEGLVTQLDLVPTVLELLGLPSLPGQRGRSLLQPHDVVHVAETHRPEAHRTQIALRDALFKMVFFPDENRFELYDLEQDPGELEDVYDRRAQERADWPERLRRIRAESTADHGTVEGRPESPTDEGMLRALGYAGEEPDGKPGQKPREKPREKKKKKR